ncbi:BglG family transcription antiterminator [Brachybacterium subflavum]|uniref:BglG family transcription antiterminator n=1 Tax=Brachybacterium subflavum TaxID=2585206 RepID=UPI00126634A8|nr:PTS sugar transporter subunit IIA [Brachybacterium subflavum]
MSHLGAQGPQSTDLAATHLLGYFGKASSAISTTPRSKETTIARTREQRERSLLDLLNEADAPLSARRLSAALGAAPRTIRDDVARINSTAPSPAILSDERGYRLSRDALNRQRALPQVGGIADGGPQARLDQVLRTIISAESTDVYELAESLHVSDSTLEGDLTKARAILKSHALTFRRHRDRLRVSGTDRDRRRLLRSLLFSREDGAPVDVMAAVRKDPEGLLALLHGAVTGGLGAHGREMNPYLLSDLLVHLAVSIEHREPVDDPTPPAARASTSTSTSTTADDGVAADVMARIRTATGVDLPAGELDILSQAITTGTGHPSADPQGRSLDDDFMMCFDDALDTVAREFGLQWGRSSSRTALARHTRLLVERARAGRQIESAFGHDFQRTLPMVHEITVHFVHHLERRTGLRFTEGEIELLSLHLGTEFRFQVESGPRVTITLVAPRYGTVTSSFADRLGVAVDPSAVIEHRIQDAARLGTITSDLVVTTVPLPELSGTPVVRVSPLLTEQDLQAVQRALRLEQDRQRRDRARARLVRLLDPALFLRDASVRTGESAMRHGASAMHDVGAVPASFETDVLERDQRSPTAFPGRFAIPHSLRHDAVRTTICVLTSDRDIDWAGTPVRLMMLFSIAPDGLPAFRDVLELLISVLSDPENVLRLAALGGDFDAFLDQLLRLLE